MTDFEAHLTRQIVFSRATFGPGARTEGVIDHIRAELDEVLAANGSPEEWVDVAILALDGLTRAIHAEFGQVGAPSVAHEAVRLILSKQSANELRDWPDWRTADPGKRIEHIRD